MSELERLRAQVADLAADWERTADECERLSHIRAGLSDERDLVTASMINRKRAEDLRAALAVGGDEPPGDTSSKVTIIGCVLHDWDGKLKPFGPCLRCGSWKCDSCPADPATEASAPLCWRSECARGCYYPDCCSEQP